MNYSVKFRKLHRKIAPILFIPLLLSALTGVIYRLGKSWFGMSAKASSITMSIHQGTYLGKDLRPFYILLIGLGLLGLIVTGLTMSKFFNKSSKSAPKKRDSRWVHRILAPIVCLPLFLSAISGIAYRIGRTWFGMSSDFGELMMVIHQGEYLGDFLKPIYVLLVGAGLVFMLVTGINMTGIFRKRRVPQGPQ